MTALGRFEATLRYRFEVYERGAAFAGSAEASTVRTALGYRSRAFHGLSLVAEGEGVAPLGTSAYHVPGLAARQHPERPAILDPAGLEVNQLYGEWRWTPAEARTWVTRVGRQEYTLNDGRFLSASLWRQKHANLDGATVTVDWARGWSAAYLYLSRFHNVRGHKAAGAVRPLDGHVIQLERKTRVANVAVYGLRLDFQRPVDFTDATSTWGVRLTGPYPLAGNWRLLYTADVAHQRNIGRNPNHVRAGYALWEAGLARRQAGAKLGYALVGGRSATDRLTNPLGHPFQGWTELFFQTPSTPGGSGLRAASFTAYGRCWRGLECTTAYYELWAASTAMHYGRELDGGVVHKLPHTGGRGEVGIRLGVYRADRLYTNAIRGSVYTAWKL